MNNGKNSNGKTALKLVATMPNRSVILRLLIRHPQIDVNLERPTDGSTSLLLSSIYGRTENAKVLLGHPDIDPNQEDHVDSTALMAASKAGFAGIFA